MRGREHEAVGERDRRLALARPRLEQHRDVHHDVAHHLDRPVRALATEIVGRRLGRAQQQRAQPVDEHPVELLGHTAVE